MFACVLNRDGEVLLQRNMKADSEHLDRLVQRFPDDIVIAVECIFTWYWIADFRDERDIPFVLGHALYMKAIHGGKSKNDKIDSHKIAGMLPMAYVYPRQMRDLLRRREYFMHQQSELLTQVQNTNTQYNYPAFGKRIAAASNRTGLAERFEKPSAQKSIEADLHLLDVYHRILLDLESEIKRQAKHHDPVAYHLLQTIPGVGPILALVILYEVHDINRFPKVGNFISYARLVKCAHESAGKRSGSGNNKIGNAHLKWAFSEAAVLFLRDQKDAKRLHQELISKYGKAKALLIIAQKLGRTVQDAWASNERSEWPAYYMLKRKKPFVAQRFFGDGAHEPAA